MRESVCLVWTTAAVVSQVILKSLDLCSIEASAPVEHLATPPSPY